MCQYTKYAASSEKNVLPWGLACRHQEIRLLKPGRWSLEMRSELSTFHLTSGEQMNLRVCNQLNRVEHTRLESRGKSPGSLQNTCTSLRGSSHLRQVHKDSGEEEWESRWLPGRNGNVKEVVGEVEEEGIGGRIYTCHLLHMYSTLNRLQCHTCARACLASQPSDGLIQRRTVLLSTCWLIVLMETEAGDVDSVTWRAQINIYRTRQMGVTCLCSFSYQTVC